MTPNTPVHTPDVDPLSSAAKENVAETPTQVKAGLIPTGIGTLPPLHSQKVASYSAGVIKHYGTQAQQEAVRSVLVALAIKRDLSAQRIGRSFDRRLSN